MTPFTASASVCGRHNRTVRSHHYRKSNELINEEADVRRGRRQRKREMEVDVRLRSLVN